jgi:hypothetical protein
LKGPIPEILGEFLWWTNSTIDHFQTMGQVVSLIFLIDQFPQQNNDWQQEFRKVENACKVRIVRVKNAQQTSENGSDTNWNVKEKNWPKFISIIPLSINLMFPRNNQQWIKETIGRMESWHHEESELWIGGIKFCFSHQTYHCSRYFVSVSNWTYYPELSQLYSH